MARGHSQWASRCAWIAWKPLKYRNGSISRSQAGSRSTTAVMSARNASTSSGVGGERGGIGVGDHVAGQSRAAKLGRPCGERSLPAKLARFRIDPTSSGASAGSSAERRARLVPHMAPQRVAGANFAQGRAAGVLDAHGMSRGLFSMLGQLVPLDR